MSGSLKEVIQAQYGATAASGLSTRNTGVKAVATAFGYSEDELSSVPAEANMGLSCGNPTALASLRPGEVVVDLGCGGGLDVFLAAQKVGPTGRAIGIDMTPEMIELARRNAGSASNVDFYLASIDSLPLPAASVDCVISNCVVNLAPDKPAVFAELARVLKPGGRVAISDLALKKPLPEDLARSIGAYVGCISGAISVETYRSGLAQAGFSAIEIVETGSDLNAYAQVENQVACCSPVSTSTGPLPLAETHCCGPASSSIHSNLSDLLSRYDINEYVASVNILAVMPMS